MLDKNKGSTRPEVTSNILLETIDVIDLMITSQLFESVTSQQKYFFLFNEISATSDFSSVYRNDSSNRFPDRFLLRRRHESDVCQKNKNSSNVISNSN